VSSKGWIGVDLDGTLAHYDGWKGVAHIGKPIGPMVERVKAWLAEGIEVRIFTARVYPGDTIGVLGHESQRQIEAEKAREHIYLWCQDIFGHRLRVTCVKDYSMTELWDDRAVRVTPNTGQPCCMEDKTQLCL
jgi:hypothetical protein